MSATPELTSVDALLVERDRVHAWLARLAERAAGAPATVVARVQDDYRQRLDAVMAQLGEHRRTIADRLAADRAELGQLQAGAIAAREGLAEAELRHTVGEYDDARFGTERQRHASALAALETELTAVAGRIAQLEDVLAIVDAAPVTTPAVEDEPVAIEALAPAASDSTIEPEPEPAPPVEEPVARPPMFEEDLLEIFEEAPPVEPPAAATTAPADEIGPLSFRPSGSGVPARPAVPPSTPPLGMPAAEDVPRFARPSAPAEPPRAPEPPPAVDSAPFVIQHDPEPVMPSPSAGQGAAESGARTLRCGECGAMNRPLEWYCEKCGAELTAI
jgi:hypothetical protein